MPLGSVQNSVLTQNLLQSPSQKYYLKTLTSKLQTQHLPNFRIPQVQVLWNDFGL